jgi:hypothetical protein
MSKIVKISEIKSHSLYYAKGRFGPGKLKLKSSEELDEIKSHRFSFEIGISIILEKLGYTKRGNQYVLSNSDNNEK